MANESLRRVNTSGGNRRVFTWAAWVKRSNVTPLATTALFSGANPVFNTSGQQEFILYIGTGDDFFINFGSSGVVQDGLITTTQKFRDCGNWFHLIVAVDSTKVNSTDRIRIYLNGSLITDFSSISYPSRNYEFSLNRSGFTINVGGKGATGNEWLGELTDVFSIDGQALTPDVFGFYKQGKGYISVGSTQATDFRPGQWVPKTPRVIKTEIIRRGGFGVNGFYLPMNDSKNFGADFHCDPNSIITLNEKLPQPRVGVASTAVGIGYTDALRADPYAANLVLALPFVSGGLSSGFGDYAPSIKGSGSVKVATVSGSVSIANTASYYGSAVSFNGATGNYISIADNTDFEFGSEDYTVEFWCNPSRSVNFEEIVSKGIPWQLYRNSNSQFVLGVSSNNSSYWINNSIGVGAINQWHHIAVSRKGSTTYGFLNGVCGLAVTNSSSVFDGTSSLVIGSYEPALTSFLFQGYLKDLRIYKGVAKYTGGFDVPRPYTPVGIATWRAVPDTTANNFATLNPLIARVASGTAYPLTFTDGNLTATANATADTGNSCGIAVTSGKWYAEYRINTNNASGSYRFSISVNPADKHWGIGNGGDQTGSIHFRPSNAQLSSASGLTYSTIYTLNYTIAIGDIIGVSLDMDNRQVSFYKNGTLITQSGGAAAFPYSFSGINSTSPYGFGLDIQGTGANQLTLNFGQNPSFSGNTTAGTFTDSNSKGLFKYQPPSGFLSLCEDNLPTPAISDPGKYFKTVLFRADGNARGITGVGFKPDLVWFKFRNAVDNHVLVDSVRGVGKRLFSDLTNAELDTPTSLMSFDDDGFSIGTNGSINTANRDLVVWCWRAGAGTTSTNTNGSITSVVSVNQDAGFSVVSYTGNGTVGATIGHGLGKTPALIIAKGRDNAVNWPVYHKSTTASNFLYLNTTTAALATSAMWNSNPSSSVFYVGNEAQNNTNALRYIAYCWAEIEGFSKFGSYVGNGSADGPFVYCGFKPAWVMIKRTDSTQNWPIIDSSRDSVNVANRRLFANLSDIEDQGIPNFVDILSNGFKCRDSNVSYNASGGTYIFAAFAESPFQTANAK